MAGPKPGVLLGLPVASLAAAAARPSPAAVAGPAVWGAVAWAAAGVSSRQVARRPAVVAPRPAGDRRPVEIQRVVPGGQAVERGRAAWPRPAVAPARMAAASVPQAATV